MPGRARKRIRRAGAVVRLADAEPGQWMSYGRTWGEQRFSETCSRCHGENAHGGLRD